jgi:hypothetical protein
MEMHITVPIFTRSPARIIINGAAAPPPSRAIDSGQNIIFSNLFDI